MHLGRQDNGDCRFGETPRERKLADAVTGETGRESPGHEMLSVPTLWMVFVINFLALGLIWAYVIRSYPSFDPARFWTGSSFIAAAGAAVAMLRMVTDSICCRCLSPAPR